MPANEIPPPAPSPADLVCVPSEPPEVRRVRGYVAVFTPLIAFGVELVWMVLCTWLFANGKLPSWEVWASVGGAPVLGPMVAKMRGKPAVATSMLLVGALGKGGAAMAAGEVAKRTLLSIVLGVSLAGCGSWAETKPYVRRANDIARELCEALMGNEANAQGISVRDLCLLPWVVAPFLEAKQAAIAAARAGKPAGEP